MTLYLMTTHRLVELESITRADLLEWQQKLHFQGKEYIKVFIPDSKTDQSGAGDHLFIAAETKSGLFPKKSMRRLCYAVGSPLRTERGREPK
mmetsp:Transcript_24031/g.32849  ORF Transcript_24031/g.32849 Transcript_24031/m.32849 type:complete len:92 (-) Transcript_24031:73-348(-)